MRDLWRAFKLILPHRGMLFWYVLTSAGVSVFASSPLVLAATFLDKLQNKGPSNKLGRFIDQFLTAHSVSDQSYLYVMCLLILIFLLFHAVFSFANTYLASWLAQRLRMEAMERVMSRLLTLDQPYYDKHKIGDLVSRMVSDGDNLRRTVKAFLDLVQQTIMVAALVAGAVYFDPLLFCLGAVAAPIFYVPMKSIIQRIARQTKRYQEKTADLAQAMLQNLSGMRIIHAYDAAAKETASFAKLAASLFRTGMRRNLSRALQRPLTEILLGIGLIAVLLFGGLRVMRGQADLSAFLVFCALMGMLRAPVNAMIYAMGEVAELLPSAERTFEVLDEKPVILDVPNAVVCPTLREKIVFENVSFDYGRGTVLKDFNLTIHAGEKIGIVGRTGVGKSTLLSLLLRFYDPTSGRILLDGADLRLVAQASLRVQMALVNQNPFLFHASVADNIRYGRPAASDDEVIAAAKAAMVHDEIIQQPEGYKTLCGERGGELFSGGQRQRISVARAILRNAPILLLDEATSALDAFSERRVQEALDQLASGRTSLIVAHRLSTLRNVDRILVFAEGGGVEAVGSHSQLLETSSTYSKLWAAQAGLQDG